MDKTWILISVGMGLLWAISCWFVFRDIAVQTTGQPDYRLMVMFIVGGLLGAFMGFVTAVVCGVLHV